MERKKKMIRVQTQQQISLIMIMMNIVHKIIYHEQVHFVKYKNTTIYYIIPLLDDTSNKSNKSVFDNITNNHKEKLNSLSFRERQPCLFTNLKMVLILKHFLVD
jgi:hypothetical protein